MRRRILRSAGVAPRGWPRSIEAPVPRAPAPGESTGPPGFLGIGAQKCGTSWWHSLLDDHPDVVTSVRKELHFFDGYFDREFGTDDIAAYHRLFWHQPGQLSGEWTPRYLSDPWVAPLLPKAAPETPLLVMLRDPIDRYVSGLTHDLSRAAPRNPIVPAMHAERGDYAPQLERLFRHVEASQVLILQYEACVADPEPHLRRTFEFLGLDADRATPQFDRQVNTARQAKPDLPTHVLAELGEHYRAQLPRLQTVAPDLDVGRWTSLANAR